LSVRKPFLIRIDPKLWDELSRWAGEELRSVNGQIEFLLREAVVRRRGASRQDALPGRKKPAEPKKEI